MYMLTLTVSGGYNGGATIRVINNTDIVFTATAPDTYNLNYNVTSGTFVYDGNNVNINITPPATSTSALGIAFTGGITDNYSVMPAGNNTSWGYNFSAVVDDTPIPASKKTLNFLINSYPVNFTIIVSDEAYNYATESTSSGQIIDLNGNLTPLGMALDELIHFDSIAMTIGYNENSEPDYIHPEIFPLVDMMNWTPGATGSGIPETRVPEITLEYTTVIINNISTHIEWRPMYIKHGNNVLMQNSSAGGYTHYAGQAWFRYSSATNPDGYDVALLIINTSFTSCRQASFSFNADGSTGVSFSNYSYQSLSDIQAIWSSIPDDPEPGPDPGTDPYGPGGNTGDDDTDPTGGDGDFDNESDEIPIPLPPSIGAVDSGFITLYNPSMSQIQDLGSFMWSDLFDLDTFKKIFNDPMQAILGLSVVPVVPPRGSSVNVKIGNIQSGVFMTQVSSQFVQKDFGQITLNEYWGGYLDYSPYTQVEIYLPFIGVRPLSTDDVMGKTLHLVYNIDLLSGACMAFIAVNEDVLYQFIGQCSCSVPITGNDWTNVINGVLGIAGAIGTTVATGGLTAPQAVGAVTAVASSVVSSKPRVEKSGSLSGMGGMLGVFSPYLIITRPRQALPANQNAFQGYPAFITRTLGSISGFTRISEVHLDNITCTDAEKQEIKTLLEQGVIL